MNLLGRIWYAIIDKPYHEDTGNDEITVSERPWQECPWIAYEFWCRYPLDDQNFPGGCAADCPARIQNENRAAVRAIENQRMFH